MLAGQNPTDPFDLRFLNAVIPHHEEAIVAGREALERAEHPELRKMVVNLVQQQEAEVQQLRHMRQE